MLAASGLSPVDGEGNYAPPTIGEFFPAPLFFADTPFAITRIHLIMFAMTGVVSLFFVLAFRKPVVVPRGLQNAGEMGIDFVRVQIVDAVMGKAGYKYMPYLTTLFFMLLAFNISGIIPGFHLAASSVVAVPLVLAVITYVLFNVEGIRANGAGAYFKANLFPPGVPAPIYVLVTPIEFISTFILRPATLTIRLLANMLAGHLILVLFFGATSYLLFEASAGLKVFAVASLAMGFAFVLFEVVVAILQAYIFTLLTAVYLDSALSHEH